MTVSESHSESQWQHHFIEANRIRLHYVTQGDGELVLLLHGFPEFWYSWRYQIPALARHYKVVVPDLRGYNDSEKPTQGYDLDTLTADIRSLIENLGYSRAHVVGHDWGGAIAWNLAQKFPQHLNRLALLSAPHPQRFAQEMLSNLDQLRRSWHVLAFQVPGVPEWLIQLNLRSFIRRMFQDYAIRKGEFSEENAQIYQAAFSKPGVIAAALNHYRQLFLPLNWVRDLWRSPDPIAVPTLVLWGDEDPLLSHKLTEGLDQLIVAPFKLKLIPHCGHWIQQEAPQTVNRELLTFLRSPDWESAID
ncbi:MAG: alpha/beta hydrolase [Myxacorys chilensis ATA2-1-KO14]|jgi:pimeloyl-ACP methyl ester carboxylesterase|nr:alpha/beta hydrolase [Myxacorys chilensis ATA2-1-KO14]